MSWGLRAVLIDGLGRRPELDSAPHNKFRGATCGVPARSVRGTCRGQGSAFVYCGALGCPHWSQGYIEDLTMTSVSRPIRAILLLHISPSIMRVYKSLYHDVPLPSEGLFQYLSQRPIALESTAFVDYFTKRSITRGQVFDNARKLAWGLKHRKGALRGETVLVYGKTSVDYPIVVLGCIAAGLVPSLASAA